MEKRYKQAMEIIEQNISIVAVPNISALIAGVFFALDPVLAIIINNGSAILAELNGLRPLLGPSGLLSLSHSLDTVALVEEENRLHKVRAIAPELNTSQASLNGSTSKKLESQLTASLPQPMIGIAEHQLNQRDLAKRLQLTSQTLSRHKSKPEFIEWSKAKDPEGIAWIYHPDSKFFHPVKPPFDGSRLSRRERNATHRKRKPIVNKIGWAIGK